MSPAGIGIRSPGFRRRRHYAVKRNIGTTGLSGICTLSMVRQGDPDGMKAKDAYRQIQGQRGARGDQGGEDDRGAGYGVAGSSKRDFGLEATGSDECAADLSRRARSRGPEQKKS